MPTRSPDREHHPLVTDRRIVVALALFCCLLWGSSYPAIKSGYSMFGIAAGDIASKLVFAEWRFLLAGVLLLLLYARVSGRPDASVPWPRGLRLARLSLADQRYRRRVGIIWPCASVRTRWILARSSKRARQYRGRPSRVTRLPK